MKSKIINTVIVTLIICIFILIMYLITSYEIKAWNNGQCDCGGRWILFDIERDKNLTLYYYQCPLCNKIIITSMNMQR